MSETLATASQQAEAAVLELHKKFLKETRPEPVLAPFNEAAIQRFEALKFPHRKHEMYTYVNTRDLVATAFSLPKGHTVDADFVKSHVYAGCEKSHLTLVDGVWDPEHSDLRALGSALKVGSLAEAAADPAVQEYLQRTIENENDVFASINSAFMKQGLVLELEPGTRLEIPFQILQVST
ncbi:MAG: Fe-S cluster assembly protein SufD, partial [Nitrospinaceae bacterium]|nr:Fe-S cluster assembly protein SufD [Nitrospinaceae bacterium]NIR53433.1 Fe-S cluster assembly protein SufD [Nitrospinaceae bacterium]NIS83837.1 Fe-S cluster assembly protein SufD [Nitrospinaceae bacterium]NIT80628.1 Fe-S cluster assembly protein SufD [Nitrospinaceae bacterium]NIU42954.1 Fe-S cluster assembly protein SufD [Nitrospinaceae bacterium]